MILVHLFHAAGRRQTMQVDGSDRDEARRVCRERVADTSDVYRAGIFDALSNRYSFDTDSIWLSPPVA